MEARKSGMPCFFASIPTIKYYIVHNDNEYDWTKKFLCNKLFYTYIDAVVHDHHIYKEVWILVVGEELMC